jgi:hypothetical protein
MPRIERAQRAFGSPFDQRVKEAMRNAHDTNAIFVGDFAKDLAPIVAMLASDPVINPSAAPQIKEAFANTRSPLNCPLTPVQ